MIDGKILIEKLLIYAETFLHLDKRDEIYFRNLLLKEFKLKEPYLGEIDFNEIKHLSFDRRYLGLRDRKRVDR